MTDTSVADTANPNPNPGANGAAAAALNTPPPPPPFWEGFSDANLKLAAEKSGYKTGEEVFGAAQKFSNFKDVDPATLRALPKADDPNAFVAFARENLGAPMDHTAYGLDKIDGVDKGLAEAAQSWFGEAGLTPFQAQHVAKRQMEHAKAEAERMINEEKADAEREMTQLQTEWKGDYEAKKALAGRAAKALGVTAEELNYLESGVGAGKVIKIFEKMSRYFKEGDFVDGDRGNQPKSLLERLYPDEFKKG